MTSPDSEYAVYPSFWVLVLSDWRSADATVTVTLRSGVQLGPGKITRLDPRSGESVTLTRGWSPDRPVTKWDFDITELVAVEAVAPR